MVEQLGIIAATWAAVMALSPILQIRRMSMRRSSADISLAYLAVLEIGFCLWVAYGASLGSLVLVVPNVMAAVVGAATIVVAARYRRSVPR